MILKAPLDRYGSHADIPTSHDTCEPARRERMSNFTATDHALADGAANNVLKKEEKPVRLKLSFLLPLAAVFLSIIGIFGFLTFRRTHDQINNSTQQTADASASMFNMEVLTNSSMLAAVSQALVRNKELEAALVAQDRSRLMTLSTPLFSELRKDHRITHFYYHDTNRVNLLRVHKPDRFGDKINRFTMIESEALGSTSSGIELGPLGTFTLRHVTPWYDSQHKLIGYVELGMEIDHLLELIEQCHKVALYMFIDKKYLDKTRWREGMRMLGRQENWNALDQHVVTNLYIGETLPVEFTERYQHAGTIGRSGFDFVFDGRRHQAHFVSLNDKGKRNVGTMWLLIDLESELADSNSATMLASGTAMFLGTILFVIFYRLVGRIESQLEEHQRALHRIATSDALTGINNRRSFDTIIASEVDRAQRYGRELSLLIIDIDHFKRVNDNFGHMAGDTVLRKLAERLTREMRTHDHLARYGGEEFAIILPETSLEMAHLIGERLRTSVGEQDYDIGSHPLHVTFSVGISSFPLQATTAEELILNADIALYRAKETGRNCVCHFDQDSPATLCLNEE